LVSRVPAAELEYTRTRESINENLGNYANSESSLYDAWDPDGVFSIRASALVKIITGTVIGITAAFTIAFTVVLGGFFSLINSPTGFFGSANVLMYLTIEFLFLFLVLYGTYVSVRHKDYRD